MRDRGKARVWQQSRRTQQSVGHLDLTRNEKDTIRVKNGGEGVNHFQGQKEEVVAGGSGGMVSQAGRGEMLTVPSPRPSLPHRWVIACHRASHYTLLLPHCMVKPQKRISREEMMPTFPSLIAHQIVLLLWQCVLCNSAWAAICSRVTHSRRLCSRGGWSWWWPCRWRATRRRRRRYKTRFQRPKRWNVASIPTSWSKRRRGWSSQSPRWICFFFPWEYRGSKLNFNSRVL